MANKTCVLGNVQLRDYLELVADFLNLDAHPNIPSSNNQSISSVCGSEENVIITNKVNTGVELLYSR